MTASRLLGSALLAGAITLGGWTPQAVAAAPETPTGPTNPAPASNARLAGPALLQAGPAKAPQLENTGIWHASPIGVCMASAYRLGEYVHQGCVYDDNGGGIQYRWFYDGVLRNYTYPENPAYRRNAADILEVRVKPIKGATAFRVTMNTMTDPKLLGLTLALGDSPTAFQAPHHANTALPAVSMAGCVLVVIVGAARVGADGTRWCSTATAAPCSSWGRSTWTSPCRPRRRWATTAEPAPRAWTCAPRVRSWRRTGSMHAAASPT